MLTAPARRSRDPFTDVGVRSASDLAAAGWDRHRIAAQVAARRWQRLGRAIVGHNAELTPADRRTVALINCGTRAVLTAFTAAECFGLSGWSREAVHVLVPCGTHVRRVPGIPVRVHYTGSPLPRVGSLDARAGALVRAAGTFRTARPACGILAAGVQQRLVTAAQLARQLGASPRIRHRAALLLAMKDIAQGAEALSEIDFATLCRRAGLPEPTRQRVRMEPGGRRRYLDVVWELPGGRRVVVEIDGALHLAAHRWWDDQVRQNELVIAGDIVLRFPSVVVRTEPHLVLDQLRRVMRWT